METKMHNENKETHREQKSTIQTKKHNVNRKATMILKMQQ